MKKCQSGILMEMTINDNYSVIINNTKQYKIKLLKPYSIIKMIQSITPGLPRTDVFTLACVFLG
ncbi:hypothetical protein CMT56_12400 [Elizabethkingia anophelis]|nr:hypothetical protein BBD30_17575 [Elizabethkingia anophelis]EQB93853.1 hypothetical protein C874_03715 [Elizabethkingia anophelis 502]KFC33601.1 hypothetical protein FF18_08470 [Elizabethkingia anophelis]MDV3500063.1 hypothetical protein [Elizabethkingia anophelis]MDV3853872.1 hypothetical protein [Elizabethkingia anophelis]